MKCEFWEIVGKCVQLHFPRKILFAVFAAFFYTLVRAHAKGGMSKEMRKELAINPSKKPRCARRLPGGGKVFP